MKFKIICLTIIFVSSITVLSRLYERNPNPLNITSNLYNVAGNKNKSKFDFNVALNNIPTKYVNVYFANPQIISVVDAKIYGGLFGYKDECRETVDDYYFENNHSILLINKNSGAIKYKQSNLPEPENTISENEAKEKAENFIKEKIKSLNYEQAQVEYDSTKNEYIVKFINTLEGKKNYAYPQTVVMDKSGNIKQIDYFKNVYIKQGEVQIISIKEAATLLTLTPIDDNIIVDIKAAELIFVLENDLVIPAYLFKGAISGDQSYQQIIPAIKK